VGLDLFEQIVVALEHTGEGAGLTAEPAGGSGL